MRTVIFIVSFVGLALFGSAFTLSYSNPVYVESIMRQLIRIEVERRVEEKLSALEDSKIVSFAERLARRQATEMSDLKRKLAEGLPQKVATETAKMLDANCECRRAITNTLTASMKARVSTLSQFNERLALLIQTKYSEVAASLIREFRIFTGANAIMFALLGGSAAIRRRAKLQLLLPACVLLGATSIVGSLYLFNQDWLRTILFSDYVGLSYFAYLSVVVVFLADIVFNRARICTRIVNVILDAVGSAAAAVPC